MSSPTSRTGATVVEQMVSLAHLVKVSDEDLGLLYPDETPEQVAARWLDQGASLVVVTRGRAWRERMDPRSAQADAPSPAIDGDRHRRRRRHLPGGAADLARRARCARRPRRWSALDGASLGALLRFAARAAAITCSRRGADMPRRSELNWFSIVHRVVFITPTEVNPGDSSRWARHAHTLPTAASSVATPNIAT